VSKPTRVAPCHPCVAIFRGVRHTSRPGQVEHIHAPVQIAEVWVGRRKELAVLMLGRATRFPLANFEGDWELLALDDGYKPLVDFWPAMDDLPDGNDILREKYGAPAGIPDDSQTH